MEPWTDIHLAIALALEYHKDQEDKSGKPYIFHPLAVMMMLVEQGESNEDILSAAVLHDVIEDCAVTEADLISKGVSKSCATLVTLLSKKEGEKYWDYIDRIKVSHEARIIKLADLKHNSDLERLHETGDMEFVSIAGRYAKAYHILKEWEEKHICHPR